MHRSYPSVRRHQQRLRFRQRALAAAAACVACGAVAFGLLPTQAPQWPQASLQGVGGSAAIEPSVAAPSRLSGRASRPVYRYSVVPGGVVDAAELAEIVRHDRVVAQHYAGFDVERARPVTLSAARAAYVSYRKGGKVYWTARKVVLPQGETLLSDGSNDMRARCANRLSDLPRLPVEPDGPNPESLDLLELEGGEAGLIVRVGIPKTAPPRSPGRPAPRLSLPPGGGFDRPAPPPLYDGPPDIQLFASVTPPPLSGAVTVGPLMPPPSLGRAEPPARPTPFVPVPDPGRPGPPASPPLDPPPDAKLPEPATAWLMAAAMVALVARRRKR